MKKLLVVGIVIFCLALKVSVIAQEKNKVLGQEKIIAFTFIGKHDPKEMSSEEYGKVVKEYYREVSEYRSHFDDSLSSRWREISKNWKCRAIEQTNRPASAQ